VGISPTLTRRKVVIGLVVLVVFVVGLFLWQAFSASRALLDARDDADRVQELIQKGDFAGASQALDDLRENTKTAHSRTSGVLWDLGRHIPYFGRNVDAVQTVSEVLDTATRINAPIALQLSKAVDEGVFKPKQGQIDLARVISLTPAVRQAADSIAKAGADLDDIRANKLTFPFNDLVGDLQDQVEKARSASVATATAFDLMPQMLGKDSPRTYLLLIQNPAEVRGSGGLPGSLAILKADKGRVTMVEQASAVDVRGFTGPVVQLPKDTLAMYGPTMASDFRDINFSPDFPESAQIAKAMVKQKLGYDVDGVISVDPIALAFLMTGTGPIQVQPNQAPLTAATAVPTLLNAIYKSDGNDTLQDALDQDQYFEDAAKAVFNAVMAGQGNQQLTIKSLAESAGQHRVLLWSADPAEQARLDGSAVSGALPGKVGDSPQVGMYLNDAVAGKVDYYLEYRGAVSAVDCRQGGAQDLRASLSVASTVPKDYQRLGSFILGSGAYAPRGTIAFNLRIYAPVGGEIVGLKVNGATHSITADEHHGRQVAFLPVALKPGENTTITADIRTGKGQDGDGVFDFTPGMVSSPNGVKIPSACD
jgi:hypothetical protein